MINEWMNEWILDEDVAPEINFGTKDFVCALYG